MKSILYTAAFGLMFGATVVAAHAQVGGPVVITLCNDTGCGATGAGCAPVANCSCRAVPPNSPGAPHPTYCHFQ